MTAAVARQSHGSGLVILAGALVVGAVLLSRLDVPDLGTVDTGTHAEQAHTLAEAERVREFYAETLTLSPEFFQQPNCKDGRYRLIAQMDSGEWAIWVLERSASGMLVEVTAFTTHNRAYVNRVRDECGNGDWFGHSYAH